MDWIVGTSMHSVLEGLFDAEERNLGYCRWADDCVIVVRSERAAQRVMTGTIAYLEEELGLLVNREKSQVAPIKDVTFLGFQIRRGKIRVSTKAQARFKERVRDLTRRNKPLSMYQAIHELNKYLRGWVGYFGIPGQHKHLSYARLEALQQGIDTHQGLQNHGMLFCRGRLCLGHGGHRLDPDDRTQTDQFVMQTVLDHQLSPDWSVDLRLQYTNYSQFNEGISFIMEDFVSPEREVWRTFADPYERDIYTYQGQINLTGRFATGPFDHTLFLGTEYRQEAIKIRGLAGIAANLDIFEPVYGQPLQDSAEALSFSNLDDNAETLAFSFQDLIELGERWNLLLGGRVDYIRQKRRIVAGSRKGEVAQQEETVFSPRIGLVFRPMPEFSLYASYSKSFRPSLNGTGADTFTGTDGSLLPITEAKQVEVGVKASLLEERLWGSIALFNIVKENVAVRDPDAPPFSDLRIPTGEQRSRGVEFELRGQLTENVELTSYYAYTDAEVTKDTTIPVGDRLRFTPEHSAGLWGQYRFFGGPLRGLRLGAGFSYYSDMEASLPNVVTIDSHTLVDASIVYEQSNWRAGVFFKNILDELYFSGGTPQDGFSVTGSIAYMF